LQNYPDVSSISGGDELVKNMDRVKDLCNAALSVRNAENIRVRQPLSSLKVVAKDVTAFVEFADIIKDELNVKDVATTDELEKYADYNLKINFPVLGKRLPGKMKDIIAASKSGQWEVQDDGLIVICDEVLTTEECELTLVAKEPSGTKSLPGNDALVILDLNITQELRVEGVSRDIVRLIQQSRKDADLNITDRINLNIQTNSDIVKEAVNNHETYISDQVLSESINFNETANDGFVFDREIEGEKIAIGFTVI